MRSKNSVYTLIAFLQTAGTLLLVSCHKEQAAPPTFPPPVVTVAPVEVKEIVEWDEFTGRTAPIDSVEVKARISGYIDKVAFQAGQMVKKGDVLFRIDPRWHEAEFKRLEAESEKAKVQAANAKKEADRMPQLLETQAISIEEADARVARYESAKTAAAAAEAALVSAKLDLEYTEVRAPIDGKVSRAYLTEGNFIGGGAGMPTLTTIVSVDPMYAYADVSEDVLLKLNKLMHEGKLEQNAEGKTPAQLQLGDEEGFPHQGYIESLDNRVDPNTGSIVLRTVFPNPDGHIVAGLFARIRIPVSDKHPVVLIDDKAIGTDQAQKFVFTLGPNNMVSYQPVVLGPLEGGKRIVRSGLKLGDKVIVNGLQRVRPGAPVTPETAKDTAAPAQNVAPSKE